MSNELMTQEQILDYVCKVDPVAWIRRQASDRARGLAAGAAVLGLLFLPPAAVLRAWVAVQIWTWYVLPETGWKLSLPLAVGLSLVFHLVRPLGQNNAPWHKIPGTSATDYDAVGRQTIHDVVFAYLYPAFSLFLAWVIGRLI